MIIQWRDRKFQVNGLVLIFSALALLLRVIFWAYTHRVWEDSLIALASVQNLWDGLGLTQHVGEGRVYSFSSPLDVIVLAAGEWAKQGITVLRLASIVSSVATIIFAGKILEACNVKPVGQIACYSYLACDHLQIFFGMSGMETQMATMLALAIVYFSISKSALAFGISCGLGVLARLELALVATVCVVPFLWPVFSTAKRVDVWSSFAKILASVSLFVLPWTIFTTIYYGSPIPQTISVKSFANGSPTMSAIAIYLSQFWKQVAPFREFWFVRESPVPDILLVGIVVFMALLAFFGLISIAVSRSRLWVAGASAMGFWAYMILWHVNSYFMWYTPPFMAITFLIVAYGISVASNLSKVVGLAFSAVTVAAYAMHLPFTMPLDREHQVVIETGVRHRTGAALGAMMQPGDTVYLEPLGYVGDEVRKYTVYDNPGLASKVAFSAFAKHGYRMIEALHPDFLVLRNSDIPLVKSEMPGFLSGYRRRFHIDSGTGDYLTLRGLSYGIGSDHEFFIFERTDR